MAIWPVHTQKEEFASVGASEAARPPDEGGNRRSITADELPAEETGGEHDGVMWVGRAGRQVGGGMWLEEPANSKKDPYNAELASCFERITLVTAATISAWYLIFSPRRR